MTWHPIPSSFARAAFLACAVGLAGAGCARSSTAFKVSAARSSSGPNRDAAASSLRRSNSLAARAGTPTVCLNNTRYRTSFVTTFTDNERWRVSNGGAWYTTYPWGPSNSGAHDGAYYLDRSDQLGRPVYDPFSASAADGLTIRAQPVDRIAGLSAADVDGYEFASGLISTSGQNASGTPSVAFAQRYGYYEVAAILPSGRGIWPSFWMLDATGARAEIDVFELLGDTPSQIYQSVHYVDGRGASYKYQLDFDPTKTPHRYGVLVGPGTDTYYIDGVATKSVPDASINPFYFIVSLQVGGADSWPGAPDATTPWPAKLRIEYFRAYEPTMASC